MNKKEAMRFLNKVALSSYCWEWNGCKNPKGYGQFRIDGKMSLAHRVAYAHWVGEIPSGFVVMHTCDVRSCVNPDHLKAGTQAENVADMISKGRGNKAKGERASKSKLTEEQVLEIRAKHTPWKYSFTRLAKEYGVSAGAIGAIIARTNWKYI